MENESLGAPAPGNNPNNDPVTQTHPSTPVLESKRRKNKKLVIAAASLILLGIAGLVYWFVLKKDSSPANNSSSTPDKQQVAESNPEGTRLNEVYYMYAEKSEGPYTLYRRPAAGGERVEIAKFDSRPYEIARNSSAYAFAVNNELWLGKYDGQKPSKIASFGDANSAVNGRFTSDGSLFVSIAAGAPGDKPEKGTLYRYDKDGGNQTEIFSSLSGSALFIEGTDGNQFALRETCWNCDGRSKLNTTKTFNYKANTYEDSSPFDFFKTVEPEYSGYRLGGDYKTLHYYRPTEDKTIATEPTLGYDYEYYVGAPYTLTRLNTETGSEATLLGNLGQKATQDFDGGKLPVFYSQGFFQQGAETATYFENKAFLVGAEGVTTLHEFPTGERLTFPVFASAEEMLAGTAKFSADGSGNPDVLMYYIDFATKQSTQIMKATNDTTVFLGVSLK